MATTAPVLKKMRRLMEEHGRTAEDIDGHTSARQRTKKAGAKTVGKKSAAAVKYRDPKSGATWTGRGRAPGWIAAAKNRDKFLVDGNVVAAKPTPAGTAKAAGNHIRGPQPAVYRDPEAGATWHGRGPAPTWLASVKDRTKFLSVGAPEATGVANAAVVSKATTAVKKALKPFGSTDGKGQRKGPQPAKYADLNTGATWSGRDPAPAWLAGAKDCTKFLADVDRTAADAKPAVAKAVAKNAPTAKKTLPRRP